jgi:hypothetical protein
MMKILSNSKNFVQNMESEYSWVIKVLKSSQNMSHINSSQRLFHNFLEKWGKKLNTDEKFYKLNSFNEYKRITIASILKKA